MLSSSRKWGPTLGGGQRRPLGGVHVVLRPEVSQGVRQALESCRERGSGPRQTGAWHGQSGHVYIQGSGRRESGLQRSAGALSLGELIGVLPLVSSAH